MDDDGLRYFLPGFIRLALKNPNDNLSLLLFYLRPKFTSTLTNSERESVFRVLDFFRVCGCATDNLERADLRRALELTRAQSERNGD